MNVEIMHNGGYVWTGYLNQIPRAGDFIRAPGAPYEYQVAKVTIDVARGTAIVQVIT